MIVVSDSSPLITLSRIDCFDLLQKLYPRIYISGEVYGEVVTSGEGLPGARQTAQADWIEVLSVHDAAAMAAAITKTGLGQGETSAIRLATELSADLVLIDERKARLHARSEGLAVAGCIGILEALFELRELSNLRNAYRQLLVQKSRIDLRTLQSSLLKFNLPLL